MRENRRASARNTLYILIVFLAAVFPAHALGDESAAMDLVISLDEVSDAARIRWFPSLPGNVAVFHVRAYDESGDLALESAALADERETRIEGVSLLGRGEVEVVSFDPEGTEIEKTLREALWQESSVEANNLLLQEPLETLDLSLEFCDSQNFPFIYVGTKVTSGGTPLLGLSTDNFSVLEDGRIQNQFFEVTPPDVGGGVRLADIVFLIDTSGSMGSEIAGVRNNAVAFANALGTSEIDFRLGLVQFGNSSGANPQIIGDGLTADSNEFVAWVSSLSARGGVEPGFSAVRLAIQNYNFRPGAKKIFILITDEDSDDRQKEATIDLILANAVTVHTAVNCGSGASNSDYCNESSLRGVSGGLLFSVLGPYDEVLDTIAESVASTYIVSYRTDNPSLDGQVRIVETTVSEDSASESVQCTYIPGGAPIIVRTAATVALHQTSLVEGSSPEITATVIDAAEPFVKTVTLHVKPTESGGGFVAFSMAPQGNDVYSATIPAPFVRSSGVEYFIRATDGQVTSSDPSTDPKSLPYVLAVLPNVAPEIAHTPPVSGIVGQDLELRIGVSDDTNHLTLLALFFRPQGDLTWNTVSRHFGPADTSATETLTIPSSAIQEPALEYYIRTTDNLGVPRLWPEGGADLPQVIPVTESSLQRYLWQSVDLPDIDDPQVRHRFDVFVHAVETPLDPSTTVFPQELPFDTDLEPVRFTVRDEDGVEVSDELTVRKALALARSAALYRKWAVSGEFDPIPVLERLGGFSFAGETPPMVWCWIIEFSGYTDTSFGYDFPGILRFPDDYIDGDGVSRLVDWEPWKHTWLDTCGWDRIHPRGLKYQDARRGIYREILKHMILQDGVSQLESTLLDDILGSLRVIQKGTNVVSLGIKIGEVLDQVNKVEYAYRQQKFVDTMKAVHFTQDEMVAFSTGFAPNNFTGWYKQLHGSVKTYPRLLKFAGKIHGVLQWVSVLAHGAEIPGEVFNFLLQLSAMANHGEDILLSLSDGLDELPQSDVDLALREAIEDARIGLGEGIPLLLNEAMVSILVSGANVVMDLVQIKLTAVAAGATIAVPPAGFALFVVDGAILAVRTAIGFVSDNLERERLEQGVVLMGTLENQWWPNSIDSPIRELLLGDPPTEELLEHIGWLISTRLYQGAFVGERLFESNSGFMNYLRVLFGDEYLEAKRREQQRFAGEIADILLGKADPYAGDALKQTSGRPYLKGQYVGFGPPGAVEYLIGRASSATPTEEHWVEYVLGSPGYIGVKDPADRRVGTFSVDGEFVDLNQITAATYTGSMSEPAVIRIDNPLLGRYKIFLEGVGNGPYLLEVRWGRAEEQLGIESHEGHFYPGSVEDAVIEARPMGGSMAFSIDAPPAERSYISGWVYDSTTMEPLPDTTVRVGDRWITTDVDGQYEFSRLLPGQVSIAASHNYYRSYRSPFIELDPGAALNHDIALEGIMQPMASIATRYVGIVGVPLRIDASASTDADGEIILYEWDWNGDLAYDHLTVDPIVEHAWGDEYQGMMTVRVKDNEMLWDSADAEVLVGSVGATLDLDPDVINKRSRGKWITAYVELPHGYDVRNIDVSTVLLNSRVPALDWPTAIGDYDGDGLADRMIKFDKQKVQSILETGVDVLVDVSGEVAGELFVGRDAVRVVGSQRGN